MTIIILAILGLVAFLAIYVKSQPDSFRFERSIAINAAPEKIFPLINDTRASMTWNPFIKNDPNIKLEFAGPPSGVGAKTIFAGNSQAGTGTVEITDSKPHSSITCNLKMTKPIAANNMVYYTLQPEGAATRVTWAMEGCSNPLSKLMHLICNVEKMVGSQFDRGLASLKSLAENS